MADLDTRSKRASSLRVGEPWVLALVFPDGVLDQGDQQHTVADYSGILASGSAVNPTGASVLVGDRVVTPVGIETRSLTGVLEGEVDRTLVGVETRSLTLDEIAELDVTKIVGSDPEW